MFLPIQFHCAVELIVPDNIAARGERLELLVNKAENLNATVSFIPFL